MTRRGSQSGYISLARPGAVISGDLLREARKRAGLSQAELALPSLERLRELIRACGLELTFRLANADLEEHDLTLVEGALAVAPDERVDRAVRAIRRVYAT